MSRRGLALAIWPLQRMNTSCIRRKKSEDGEFLGEDRYLVWTGEGGSEGKGGTTSHQTSHVLEEVPMERESLIITLLAEDFRERALLLTTRSAMFDQISVTNFEQSICFWSRWHFVHHFCGKILKKDSCEWELVPSFWKLLQLWKLLILDLALLRSNMRRCQGANN